MYRAFYLDPRTCSEECKTLPNQFALDEFLATLGASCTRVERLDENSQPVAQSQADAVNGKLAELGVPTAPAPVPPHLSFAELLRVGFSSPQSLAELLRVGLALSNDNFDAGFARGLARGMELATPPTEGCRNLVLGGVRCAGRLVWSGPPATCSCRELVCVDCRTTYKNECADHRDH
jgi:hypothetical protein